MYILRNLNTQGRANAQLYIEKEIASCFSLFYLWWASFNSCSNPWLLWPSLTEVLASAGHPATRSTHSPGRGLLTAASSPADRGCCRNPHRFGYQFLWTYHSFQYWRQVWWGGRRIDFYEQHFLCCLLACWNQWVKLWELLRRDYTYHRWTRKGLQGEDTRKGSWGQGHKGGLLLLSSCLPVCFQTTQAFLFRGTLVAGVRGEEK